MPQSAKKLLDTPFRQQHLKTIWQNVSMYPGMFNKLYQKPIEKYAEIVQLLPASESHYHSHMAVSAFTEKSQNLIPLDYIAALVGYPYQHTANVIVKQLNFPKGVRLKEKSHPRWIAGEVIRWCRINAKRIK